MARITITKWVQTQLSLAAENWQICVDATAGKGNDTLFLCENCKTGGKVLAFDIQKQALEITGELLEKHGHKVQYKDYANAENIINIESADTDEDVYLIQDGHQSMDKYLHENTVDVMMFNLGYLPGGDHALATRPDTTITAIEKGLTLLKSGGIMSICIYSGGDSGFEERNAVLEFLEKLDDRKYTVIVSRFYNKPNNPPIPVLIMKK